jgi:hypothetical protein
MARRSIRTSYTQRVADYFEANKNVWIDSEALMRIGGRNAWRTRVSNCRTEHGMHIENRTYALNGLTVSEYRYVPAAVGTATFGREASDLSVAA